MQANHLGILCAICSALFMGTIGVFSRKSGAGAESVAFYRLLFGAGFTLLFLLFTGKTRLARQWPGWAVPAGGISLAGFVVFYIESMAYTTMANAVMMIYLAPIAASIYAHFFLQEKISTRGMLLMLLALFGFAMMLEFRLDFVGSGGNNSGQMTGLILAMASMVCYATYILVNRIVPEQVHVYSRALYQLFVGAMVLLPLQFFAPVVPGSAWPWLVGAGFLPGFLAILCAVVALSRLPAATFGTLAYCEPVAVMLFGWFLFQEQLSPLQLGGAACIIASGVARARLDSQTK
ncbi:MAG: DMT family transporter [bacterium]|nr:DMT family transporter [bacterium]